MGRWSSVLPPKNHYRTQEAHDGSEAKGRRQWIYQKE